MKITMNNYHLLTALRNINRTIKNSNQLSNKIQIKIQTDHIYLEASNDNKSISIRLNSKNTFKENEQNIIITPISILTNLVAKLEADETTFILENEKLKLVNGTVNANLPIDNESNYVMPVLEKVNGLNIEPQLLNKLVTNTIPFCLNGNYDSINSNQIALTTINLTFEENIIKAMASNSHIGVKLSQTTKNKHILQSVNIPVDTAMIIQNLAREAEKNNVENIIIQYNKTGLYVISNGIKFFSSLITATYPPLEKILENKGKKIITINRERMLKSAERMKCFVEKESSSNPIILILNNKNANIQISSALGTNNEELYLETNNDDIDFKIALNSEYLIQTLKTATTDTIQFYIQSNIHPLIIKSEETEFVISPLRIRTNKDSQAA